MFARARGVAVVPAGQGGRGMRCTGTWADRGACRGVAGGLGCAAIRAKGGGGVGRRTWFSTPSDSLASRMPSGQRYTSCMVSLGPAPAVPRREPSRSAHRPASPRQAAAERDVVEEGAVLRLVVGHESAPMARRACSAYRGRNRSPSRVPVRVRGDPGRRSVAGVTRGHRAPVSAANESPRWSAVPGGSRWTGEAPRRAPKLAVF